MRPFHSVAIPHKDIMEKKLTMNVFAADLADVQRKSGPEEYKDSSIFFKKTYITEGLNSVLYDVEKRLKGQGGDPVIQMQTPFGGGKTHSLIAMYHRCQEWGARTVVIAGTDLDANKTTLWGLIEYQLTDKIENLKGNVSTGKNAIRNILKDHQPCLILMDEVLEYVTKAAGVRVEDTSLASQTIAFIQELTEAISTLDRVCLVITLPSSVLEHYDEKAERLFQQLQRVTGRVEKIISPINENEITRIIQKRLFSDINRQNAKDIVDKYVEYAEKERILPPEMQPSEYRERFNDSYPFLPDLIDLLYHKWGSYHSFQRTRGVLRLLSLIIYNLKNRNISYIGTSDIDLGNQDIRQEFIKHAGPEFNSIIAADITNSNSNARGIDKQIGNAYSGFSLGIRVATCVFLNSFSSGQERGATTSMIKRSAANTDITSSIITDVLDKMDNHLYFMQKSGDKYYFSSKPNLNKVIIQKMDNAKEQELIELEKDLLLQNISRKELRVYIWEDNPGNIHDNEDLKLVILPVEDLNIVDKIVKQKGQNPRVNRNTLFFLLPAEFHRSSFIISLKRSLAYRNIEDDTTLNLDAEQRKKVRDAQKKLDKDIVEMLQKLYSKIIIVHANQIKTIDMGIPTYGEINKIDSEVFKKLRDENEILAKVAPLVIKEMYLKKQDFIMTNQLYKTTLHTPGEIRLLSRDVLETAIIEGVKLGIFGLGDMESGNPVCRYYREEPNVTFSDSEIIIDPILCEKQKKSQIEQHMPTETYEPTQERPEPIITGASEPVFDSSDLSHLSISFRLKEGKVSEILRVLTFLQTKFSNIILTLKADKGTITSQEYEEKIKETFNQLGIDIE